MTGPTPDPRVEAAVCALVRDWLVDKGVPAQSVESVVAHGCDDAGSTEDGWHYEFDVDIWYTLTSGKRVYRTLQGEELEPLWMYVLRRATEAGSDE